MLNIFPSPEGTKPGLGIDRALIHELTPQILPLIRAHLCEIRADSCINHRCGAALDSHEEFLPQSG